MDLVKEPVNRVIIRMSIPMMVGFVGVVSLNLIDAYFIGKLGTEALAAIGYTFPAILLQGAISGGLGVGASAVISKAIGQKNRALAKRLTTDSLILSVSIVIVFVVLGEFTIDPLFRSMGASETSMIIIREYMRIWYLGLPFVVVPMVGNGAIRSTGNTIIPAVIMVTAMISNTVLDRIMIFGWGNFPAMGIKGAAIATVISRVITMTMSLSYLIFKLKMVTVASITIKSMTGNWLNILQIAIPAGLTRIFLPLSMGFITRLVSGYGIHAVAAMGMGLKIEMFTLVPVMAISTIIIPFTGQNLGAGKNYRVMKGFSVSFRYSFFIGILAFLVFLLFGSHIGRLFNNNMNVYRLIHRYLCIASIGYGMLGVIEIAASILNALHKSVSASLLHLFRMVALYIPLAAAGSKYIGLTGIFTASAVSSIIAGALAIYLILKVLNKSIS